jgi:hypothetical protein
MALFKDDRDWRVSLAAPESIATLSAMERFFRGGKKWTQGEYHRGDGTKCLVGAVETLRASAIDDARYWLSQAIAERTGAANDPMLIEHFNDTHSFAEVAKVIDRAKQLAAAAAPARLPPLQLPSAPPASPLRALSYQPEVAMNEPGSRARQPDPVRARR